MKKNKKSSQCTIHPKLAAMWHPIMNEGLLPGAVTPDSDYEAWWLCPNGHDWVETVWAMTQNPECPYCSGKIAHRENNLLIHNQSVACLWHPDKNGELTPDMVLPTSTETVWWQCQHGHEWRASVIMMSTMLFCPKCSEDLDGVWCN